MRSSVWSTVIAAVLTSVFSACSDGCEIPLEGMSALQPVLFISPPFEAASYKLFKPTGKISILPINANLRLTCPGLNNVIESLKVKTIDLICRPNSNLETATGEQYALAELLCKSIPVAELQETSEECGASKDGYILKAGFHIDTNDFAPVFTICYDKSRENTLYTHNTINGPAIQFATSQNTRRGFRANGMKLSTTVVNNYYTITNQIKRFNMYFGNEQIYVNKQKFLARGHLTPDADFIFAYEQLATYFYANVAPEFQIINAGNWVRVENLVRSLAADFGDDLEIYNGYMGQLQFPHPQTEILIDVFLDDTQLIEVPKYYFKVIKHEASDSAIVMITLNNPYATELEMKEFCTNVCATAGFQNPHFSDVSRGYTFCCELDEFKEYYSDLPDDLYASNLLYKGLWS